jgi:protein-S-isoprenylcysteine O-methyltransferase Ste14
MSDIKPHDQREPKLLIKLGKFFFRHRGITPIPYWLALFIASILQPITGLYPENLFLGILFIVSGEYIRMACVRRASGITRTRSNKTGEKLITDGLFRFSRNPIYLGNGLIGLGMTSLAGIIIAFPIFILIYLMQYIPIIAWEETILEQKFGDQYRQYKRDVPRWIGISRLKRAQKLENTELYDFKRLLRNEKHTLLGIIFISILLSIHYFF